MKGETQEKGNDRARLSFKDSCRSTTVNKTPDLGMTVREWKERAGGKALGGEIETMNWHVAAWGQFKVDKRQLRVGCRGGKTEVLNPVGLLGC